MLIRLKCAEGEVRLHPFASYRTGRGNDNEDSRCLRPVARTGDVDIRRNGVFLTSRRSDIGNGSVGRFNAAY